MTIFKCKITNKLYTISKNRGIWYDGRLTAEPYNHTISYKDATNKRIVKLNNFNIVGYR